MVKQLSVGAFAFHTMKYSEAALQNLSLRKQICCRHLYYRENISLIRKSLNKAARDRIMNKLGVVVHLHLFQYPSAVCTDTGNAQR